MSVSDIDIPEIADGSVWLKAGLARRFSVYQKLSRALGPDWAVSRAGSAGRDSDPLRPVEIAGLSLVHQPSSLAFRLVPGFACYAGFSAGELDPVREAMAAAGKPAQDGPRLPSDGGQAVNVAPFLLCACPVRVSEVGALIRLDGGQGRWRSRGAGRFFSAGRGSGGARAGALSPADPKSMGERL